MNTIFIVTEANANVATGHLMECIVCAEELIRNGYEVSFWINDDVESGLKKRIPCRFREYHRSIENDHEVLIEEVCRICPKVLLFNLREISGKFLEVCNKRISDRTMVICIDEFGHRNLQADIIINPMIDPYYWDYGESKAKLFCGAKYLILSERLEKFYEKEKQINSDINKIVVSMGGVDSKNYTSDLIDIISEKFPDAAMEIIIGGGNQHRKEITERAVNSKNITLKENISNLLDLMYEADLVFCAGGNTLHEVACIGTPVIVLPSMPHEERTAKCFEKKGFGLMVDVRGDRRKNVLDLCDRVRSYELRNSMHVKGKMISDGKGRKRVLEVIDRSEKDERRL